MKILVYAGIVSPHMIPLCDKLATILGKGNMLYCATLKMREQRVKLGWREAERDWIVRYNGMPPGDKIEEYAEIFDVLFASEFCPKVIERFKARHKLIIYPSERWLKPPWGAIRFFKPSFIGRAKYFASLLNGYGRFIYLPIGPYAAKDAIRIARWARFGLPVLTSTDAFIFEKVPLGCFAAVNGKNYLLDKMRLWGYFVAPSKDVERPVQSVSKTSPHEIKTLWVGRLLSWKCVDTIARAVGEHANCRRSDASLPKITLDIYGTGPEEARLKKIASSYGDVVKFHPPVSVADIRPIMRDHDVYVLGSNGYEGWGAVVSEALEEGMEVVGTFEAGSSAAILPESNLFHAGDWRSLLKILQYGAHEVSIGEWSAANAAEKLVKWLDDEVGHGS